MYSKRPHIACICETWLKTAKEPTFINYTCYFRHKEGRTGGGLAILVRNDVNAKYKKLDYLKLGKLAVKYYIQ